MMDELSQLIEKLRSFHQVVVTGPHRSGTRFISKALAQSLNYRYCDEDGIGDGLCLLHTAIRNFKASDRRAVYQAPLMMAYVGSLSEDTAIVCSRRPVDEIELSENRIGWEKSGTDNRSRFNAVELSKFFGEFRDTYNNRHATFADALKADPECRSWARGRLSEIKYMIWDKYMKPSLKNAFDVDYHWFKDHPLFIEKEKREKFLPTQTSI